MSMLIEIDSTTPVPVHGYLAIDSLVDGEAHGGLRISDDVSAGLLAAAARTMTLKYGFARLPVGGAKAGIKAPSGLPPEDRRALLHAFGRALRPYLATKTYVPGEDMGTSGADINEFMQAAGLRPVPRSLTHAQSGYYTGIGLCTCALALAEGPGNKTSPVTVSIEGFGNVGSAAAMEFLQREARVVAVSTSEGAVYNPSGLDVALMVERRRQVGNHIVNESGLGEQIKPEDLGTLGEDVFAPCAIMHSIDSDRAQTLTARVVCPGANVPYTQEAEEVMRQRGITYAPDFVANCGGVLGASIARAGIADQRVQQLVRRRVDTETRMLLIAAREQSLSVAQVAEQVALQRFEHGKATYERHSPRQQLFRTLVGLHRRGLIPRALVARAAGRYFVR